MYRDILESLLKHTDGKHLITVKQAAEFLGCSEETVRSKYKIKGKPLTVEALARKLCE